MNEGRKTGREGVRVSEKDTRRGGRGMATEEGSSKMEHGREMRTWNQQERGGQKR